MKQYKYVNKCKVTFLTNQNMNITQEETLDLEILIRVQKSKKIVIHRVDEHQHSQFNKFSSILSLRVTEQQYLLSRSFNLDNLQIGQQQYQRRRSGNEKLSEKQLRIDCLYPKTQVSQQEADLEILQELQRTKERKKTLFKRMSSILIKNCTVLKNFNSYNRASQQEVPLIALQNLDQYQQQYQVETQQEEKNQTLKQYSPQPRYSQRQLSKKELKSRIIDTDQPKVVLSLTKRSKKPCVTIQNYINERTLSIKDLNFKIPLLSTSKLNYIPNQSLTEFQDQIQSPKSYRKSQIVQTLPEIKLINSERMYQPNVESYLIRSKPEKIKNISQILIKPNSVTQQNTPLFSFSKKCKNLLTSNQKRKVLRTDEKL